MHPICIENSYRFASPSLDNKSKFAICIDLRTLENMSRDYNEVYATLFIVIASLSSITLLSSLRRFSRRPTKSNQIGYMDQQMTTKSPDLLIADDLVLLRFHTVRTESNQVAAGFAETAKLIGGEIREAVVSIFKSKLDSSVHAIDLNTKENNTA